MSQEYAVFKKFTAQDYATVPFNASKRYTHESSASADTNGVKVFNTSWTSESISTYSSSSVEFQNTSDTIHNIHYNQLNHLFYKDFKKDCYHRFGTYDYKKQKRVLYEKADIISVPAGHYGHSVKKNTFFFQGSGSFWGTTPTDKLIDDSEGNLILSGTNVDNYNTDFRSNVFNVGPIEGYKRYDLGVYDWYIRIDGYKQLKHDIYRRGERNPNPPTSYTTLDHITEYDDSYFFNPLKYKNVNYTSSALFDQYSTFPVIKFNGTNSEIKAGNSEKYNFNKEENFTLSLWADVSQSSNATSYLISKSTTKTIVAQSKTVNDIPEVLNYTASSFLLDVTAEPQHPFELYVKNGANNAPHIYFSRSDGQITTLKSASFTTGSTQHVTCRYSSSQMEIFINGLSLGSSGSDNLNKQSTNTANLYIGNKGGSANFLTGSLSQINIYNSALTDTQILNHYSSSNNSPYVGNIFYSHGIATITHPRFSTIDNVGTPYIQYEGNHLIYEHEYQCTVEEHEYNSTYNISSRKIQSSECPDIANFATGSIFKPYITTIGLYDEDQNLLVVGKLGQPMRMSDETDTTFVLRWDT